MLLLAWLVLFRVFVVVVDVRVDVCAFIAVGAAFIVLGIAIVCVRCRCCLCSCLVLSLFVAIGADFVVRARCCRVCLLLL